MITLCIENIFTDIHGNLSNSDYDGLQKKLSFFPNGYEFSTQYNTWIKDPNGKALRRVWDGRKRQIWKNKKRTYFPTGLFGLVKDYLVSNNIQFSVQDNRVKPTPSLSLKFAEGKKLRKYQLDRVVIPACDRQRGIIQLATGAGKTICSAGIIQRLNIKPFIFFVTSIDLLTQAKESFEEFLLKGNSNLQVGQVGGGVVDIKDINVMTIQTAVRAIGEKWNAKYKFDSNDQDDKTPIQERRKDILDLLRSARGAISDEIQHWKADTCQLVVRELKNCYYTFGASATPYRDEGDDMMIQACFGKNIVEISASELIKEKWLIKPTINIVDIKSPPSQYRQWQQIYKDQVSESIEYNSIVSSVANSYIKNKRLVLVLIQQIAHGKRLSEMIPGSIFLSGSSSKKKRQEGINKLRNREISCIVSSVIFDEGIDVRPLDTLILAGQGKCLTGNTLVPSNDGLLTIEELFNNHNLLDKKDDTFYPVSNGDIILDSASDYQRITRLYYGGSQKCKQITLKNGLQIEGTFNHRIRILRNGKIKYCQLQSVKEDDFVVIKKCSYMFGNNPIIQYQRSCNNCKNVNLPNEMNPTLARLIAYCLTEGYTVRDDCIEIGNIFAADIIFFKEFEKMFGVKFNKCFISNKKGPHGEPKGWLYRFCNKEFIKYLRQLGVKSATSRYKEIPLSIRSSDIACVRTFLRAVFDAEGHINKFGIEITMGSESFIKTLQVMLLNMNIMSRLSVKPIKSRDYWRLKIEDSRNLNKFYKEINFDCDYKESALKDLIKRKYNPSSNIIPGIKNICNTIMVKCSKKHSTAEYKKANKFITKLSPSSKQEFTHDSLKLFLGFFDEDNWHIRYLKFLVSDIFEYVQVEKSKTTYNKEVYDFTAPLHHYVANGTLSHNSKVRAMQRIGRILRPFKGKTQATAIDFRIHQKYLLEHSKLREKMYKTEPEFEIKHIDPGNL